MKQRIIERGSKDIQYVSSNQSELLQHHAHPHDRIMYTIHGQGDLEEIVFDHLSGYKNAGPVRIGNGAADQYVFGLVLGLPILNTLLFAASRMMSTENS